MRIAVFARNGPSTYSGGRYASLMMAEALALAGHETHYITDNRPIFYDDFSPLPAHAEVLLHVSGDFVSDLPEGDFDIVVLVPHLPIKNRKNTFLFTAARMFAGERGAKLVLLNFETPNWFNSLSPTPRDESLWESWRECCKDGCLVLSLSREGTKYAGIYYRDYPELTKFDYCYPSINNVVADSVSAQVREKRIVVITRFEHRHKGGFDAIDMFCPAMNGYTVVFLVGQGTISQEIMDKTSAAAEQVDAKAEFRYRINDVEKFREIKRSSLMLFPSYFEEFGYPPVEARYCGTPCIAYDLNVLREINGDGIHYVSVGDVEAFKGKIEQVLEMGEFTSFGSDDDIVKIARIENYAERLDLVLRNYIENKEGIDCLKISQVGFQEPLLT